MVNPLNYNGLYILRKFQKQDGDENNAGPKDVNIFYKINPPAFAHRWIFASAVGRPLRGIPLLCSAQSLALYVPLLVIGNLLDFHAPQPSLSSRRDTVVMEQVPASPVLADGMVGGPSHHRLQQHPAPTERAVGGIPHGIAQQMRVARGIREVVFPLL